MAFTYNPRRPLEVTDGKSRLYASPKLTDARTHRCVFENGQFHVEFDFLVTSKWRLYRWRGQQREGSFESCAYIIEPVLRGNFIKAWQSYSGGKPDSAEYQKFRERIVNGMNCLCTEKYTPQVASPDFEFPPTEFSVRFVQKYDELPNT